MGHSIHLDPSKEGVCSGKYPRLSPARQQESTAGRQRTASTGMPIPTELRTTADRVSRNEEHRLRSAIRGRASSDYGTTSLHQVNAYTGHIRSRDGKGCRDDSRAATQV